MRSGTFHHGVNTILFGAETQRYAALGTEASMPEESSSKYGAMPRRRTGALLRRPLVHVEARLGRATTLLDIESLN